MVKDISKNKQGQWCDLGKLGISKKGNVTVKTFSLFQSPEDGCARKPAAPVSLFAAASFAVLLMFFCGGVAAQEDSLSKIKLMAANDSTAKESMTVQGDSLSKNKAVVQKEFPSKNTGVAMKGLTSIALTDKKIRASGWGEYVVGGHCLCCDNMRSADCITVNTTNRTDKLRIKQIIDGKTEADTGDNTTYFGDLFERDVPTKPVALLMAEITLPNLQEFYRVIVYTVADSLKKKNVAFNCELGYTDQFDRLQWAGKVENSGHDDHIIFDFEKPILTKDILLKVKDGRNRITEVAIFVKNKQE
jgi:hypothetical protein